MKNQKLLVLGLLWSSYASAADVVPTQFKAFETDLARPELQLNDSYSYRLGINYVEGHKYVLHPVGSDLEDASSIRREFNLSLRLPFQLEAGAALYDSQQGSSDRLAAIYGDVNHKSQHLGGAIWARYHLIQSEKLSSSIVLQYERGTADKASFHQASQDKTGVAIHVAGSPFAYTQAGAFLGMTRRQDESFRGSRLNDELLYGTRISIGQPYLQVFGETQVRMLPWKTSTNDKELHASRAYEFGISGNYNDVSVQASAFIPTTRRYVGVPERGFHLSVQLMLGKKSSTSTVAVSSSPAPLADSTTRPALKGEEEKAAPEVQSIDDLNVIKSNVKEEGLGQIPVFEDRLEKTKEDMKAADTLTTPGADEFQKWDEQQTAESQRKETATERAEREYKAQIANDAKLEKAKAAQEIDSKQAERERLLKEIEAEERDARDTKGDIEKELNEYTLPDRDDVNWNGLQN
jgi:hypothetical protein